MLLVTTLALMAQPLSPHQAAPEWNAKVAHARTVACHPDPSKNRGCYRSVGAASEAAAKPAEPGAKRVMVSCHPDPSKNRGCLRPLFRGDKPEKLAMKNAGEQAGNTRHTRRPDLIRSSLRFGRDF